MKDAAFKNRIAKLAALNDPLRSRLYSYVASRYREVGREEAASAVGVSRSLAGFHLDKLAEQGLLETSFRRLSGRTGPGAGRPAKLYRRAARDLAVSLPHREYEVAARLLATAVDASGSEEVEVALHAAARSAGARMVEDAQERAATNEGESSLHEAMEVLMRHGYEPVQEGGEIRLRNCPFHALAAEHTALVCGMNLALLEGVASALEGDVTVSLDPEPGMCCVRLRIAGSPSR